MEDGRRVVIDPEDVNDSDGTVKGALILCCGSIGKPMGFNPFQSMYFALIREYSCRDEGAVPEETGAARQKRIRALYQEVLRDLWGSEYRTQIPPAPIVAVSTGESILAMSAESEEPGLATEGEEQQFPLVSRLGFCKLQCSRKEERKSTTLVHPEEVARRIPFTVIPLTVCY